MDFSGEKAKLALQCVLQDNLSEVKRFVCNGWNPNLPVDMGLPLHLAIEKGLFAIADLLLEAGADPNLPSGKDKLDAFAIACKFERVGLIEMLLKKHKLPKAAATYHPYSANKFVRLALEGKFQDFNAAK
jgi:ankyrin repeat protein